MDRHRERIATCNQAPTDVDLVRAKGAVDDVPPRQLLAVEPDIGGVVDAVELQACNLPSRVFRHVELGPVPPGALELLRVYLFEVCTEVEIGVAAVGNQCRHRGRGHRSRKPAIGIEIR